MGFNRINDKDVAMLEGFNDFWHRPISYFSGDAPNEIEKLLDKFKHEMLFWIKHKKDWAQNLSGSDDQLWAFNITAKEPIQMPYRTWVSCQA